MLIQRVGLKPVDHAKHVVPQLVQKYFVQLLLVSFFHHQLQVYSCADVRAILGELALGVRAHVIPRLPMPLPSCGEKTQEYGRGLGDRSCMALGLQLGLPVLTADREWKKVKVRGLQLKHLR